MSNRTVLEVAVLLGANPHIATDIVLDLLSEPKLDTHRAIFLRTGIQNEAAKAPAPANEYNLNQALVWTNDRTAENVFIPACLIVATKAIWEYLNGHYKRTATCNIDPDDRMAGKVDAIKYLRSKTNLGLYEAKCITEELCNPFGA